MNVTETGLSDYYKLTSTSLKSNFIRLRSKVIRYKYYKRFDGKIFLNDLHSKV